MKRRRKLLIGLPLLAVVSLGALLWGIRYTGQRALDEAMAGVVADGGPTDFLGFDRPDLADEDNAALAWLRAVEPLEAIDAAAPEAVWPEEPDASWVFRVISWAATSQLTLRGQARPISPKSRQFSSRGQRTRRCCGRRLASGKR